MVKLFSRRPNKKQQLLEHAAQLITLGGFSALTIEGLSQVAGLTKGGVQYHFASKDQIITELLEFLLGYLDHALDGLKGKDWLQSYVNLTLGEPTDSDGAVSAIIAALPPGDPRCEPFERFTRKWRLKANDSGLDPALAQIIRLAADGAWLERSFGSATSKDTAAIRKKLLQLIKDNHK